MKVVFQETKYIKTYKTYDRALKEAQRLIGDKHIRVIISATPEGRFFPVALGEESMQEGLHFHMATAS